MRNAGIVTDQTVGKSAGCLVFKGEIMPRANSSVPRHRRHRKIVKQAKGYYGARSRNYKAAKDAVTKADYMPIVTVDKGSVNSDVYGYCGINAAARLHGMSYSAFIAGLKSKEIELNRKAHR
jgi:large subunit ribosomal protein L20